MDIVRYDISVYDSIGTSIQHHKNTYHHPHSTNFQLMIFFFQVKSQVFIGNKWKNAREYEKNSLRGAHLTQERAPTSKNKFKFWES